MSDVRAAIQPTRMSQEEAEEFMALLLMAQKGDHDCPYAKYFRKIGQRMTEKFQAPTQGQ